ncbi:MAG: BMP family ABC transporter substrate-binding protein [Caldilineaceae bacterium]
MLHVPHAVAAPAAPAEPSGPVVVFGAYATAIEEPWDGVIHTALNQAQEAGRIAYTYTDDIGYSGDMERILREVAEETKPAVIFGDAFGNEEAVRRVAKDYPEIAFVFGSGGGPAEPNFSVFDNWIHEPAYLSGMLAGGLTASNTVGVVGGLPVPEVNRIVNAFIAGAEAVNPDVVVLTTFINSWFDSGCGQGSRLGPDRRGRGRALRRTLRRHRGRGGERAVRVRQHERPVRVGPRVRGQRPRVAHGAHGRLHHQAGRGGRVHGPGSQGLQHGGQGRREPGAHQRRRDRRHSPGADRRRGGQAAGDRGRPLPRMSTRPSRLLDRRVARALFLWKHARILMP